MFRATLRVAVLGIAAFALTGCTTYYKVSDPTTGKSYYTTKLKELHEGATQFQDAKSKTEVTIQNSQVQKITKEQYEAALYAAPSTRGT